MKKSTKTILVSFALFALMFTASQASAQSSEPIVYTDAQIEQMKKDAEANNPNSYENKQATDNGKQANNNNNNNNNTDKPQPAKTTSKDDEAATENKPKN